MSSVDSGEKPWAEHPETDKPYRVEIFLDGDPRAQTTKDVIGDVFFDEFGEDADYLEQMYGEYRSVYFLLTDQTTGAHVGAARLLKNSPVGLKAINDLTEWGVDPAETMATVPEFDQDRALDHATLAVPKEYRKTPASVLIYRTVIKYCQENDIRFWVGIYEKKPLESMQAFNEPFHRFPGLEYRRYHRAPESIPVWADLAEFEPRLAKDNPDLHNLLFNGEGVDHLMS